MSATTTVFNTVGQVASALGGVAGIGALFTIGIKRRQERANATRSEADATKVVTDTALAMLMPLKAQSAYLAGELEQSRTESERLRDDVHRIADELYTSRDIVARLRDDVRTLHEFVGQLLEVITTAGLPILPRPILKDNPAAYLTPPRKRATRKDPPAA